MNLRRSVPALCLAALLWGSVAAPSLAAPVVGLRAQAVRLAVFDAQGRRLTFAQTIAITTNGAKGWRNDATYRVGDGSIMESSALYNDGGDPAFDVSEAGLGLTLAWRTASTGYSTLFLDDLGAGFSGGQTVNLTYRAALDYRAKLDGALSRRPAYVPTQAFTTARDRADDLLAQAGATGPASERGALGQQALDGLAVAFERLLESDGRQEGAALDPWWGVTVDRTVGFPQTVVSIHDLVDGTPGDAAMRVVFDLGVGPSAYDGIVRRARSQGVAVVGQILDSFPFHKLTVAQWKARVRTFVDHFPRIDVWEVGNEVNGEWLGSSVGPKVAYAAHYVKAQDPTDVTMLTFYWQMGTAGHPGNAVFGWIGDHVTPQLEADVDVVALSTWIGDAPLGIAHDEVFERLHALFHSAQVAMGELGYWEPDTSRVWWWRSSQHPTTTVRRALAKHLYLANLSFPYSIGGGFWWYYVQEMAARQPLWHDLHDAYRSVEG